MRTRHFHSAFIHPGRLDEPFVLVRFIDKTELFAGEVCFAAAVSRFRVLVKRVLKRVGGGFVGLTLRLRLFRSVVMAGTAKEEKDGEFGGPGGMHMLDTATSDRSVWLLKVPPLVGNSWLKQQDGGPSLAKVTMSMDPLNPNPADSLEFTLTLPEKDLVAPHKSYTLNVTKDLVPMHIFSEAPQGKLRVEGKVEHKFDMKPTNIGNNDEYRKLCRDRLNKSMVKTRTTQVLSNDRGGFMRPPPVDWQGSTFTGKDNKKRAPISNSVKTAEGKRTRRDRGELEGIIFNLFERRPNWALKQLVEETDQPVAFLKEVLNDLCIYNKRGANQGTYELKPEYRRKPKEEDVKAAT